METTIFDKLCNQAHLAHSRRKLWHRASESGSEQRQVCISSLLDQQKNRLKKVNDPNKNVYGMARQIEVLRSI